MNTKMCEIVVNDIMDELSEDNKRLSNELSFERQLNEILVNVRKYSLVLFNDCKCDQKADIRQRFSEYNTCFDALKTKKDMTEDMEEVFESNANIVFNSVNFNEFNVRNETKTTKTCEIVVNDIMDELREDNKRLSNELSFERQLNEILVNVRKYSLVLFNDCKCDQNSDIKQRFNEFNTSFDGLKLNKDMTEDKEEVFDINANIVFNSVNFTESNANKKSKISDTLRTNTSTKGIITEELNDDFIDDIEDVHQMSNSSGVHWIKLDDSYINAYYETVLKKDETREQKAKTELKKSKRKDYYKLLDVSKTASEDEIKKAYKKRALIHHPDRHTTASETEQREQEKKFKKVGEAYAVLTDPKMRSRYDSGVDLDGEVDPSDPFETFWSVFRSNGTPVPGSSSRRYQWCSSCGVFVVRGESGKGFESHIAKRHQTAKNSSNKSYS